MKAFMVSRTNRQEKYCSSRFAYNLGCKIANLFYVYFISNVYILQSCSISIFPYRFNINYSVCFLININITINYLQEGLSISILYQLLKKLPYQFQYQYILSISPYDIVMITNFLSISHCYQCCYQL